MIKLIKRFKRWLDEGDGEHLKPFTGRDRQEAMEDHLSMEGYP